MTTAGDTGRLTDRVLDYERTLKGLVPTITTPSDWDALARHVNVAEFERIGTFLEVQDWTQYTQMLTQWASSIDSFETSVRRIDELPGVVYFTIEERHQRGDRTSVVNSLTVFQFDRDDLVRHVDVFLQQPR